MGKIIRFEIRDNYAKYNMLLKERKSVFEKVISISKVKSQNKNYLINDSTSVKHISLLDEITLIVEVKIYNYKNFNFKLKCKSLSDMPFFRFDSAGETHRNHDDAIPLSEQQVPPPHFHCFNQDGLLLAYKTPELKIEEDKIAFEDIKICIVHFCNESNIRLNDDDFPMIDILPGTFQFETIEDDPNKGVDFL